MQNKNSRQKQSSFGGGVYFDYAASTPVDPRVELAMRPYFLQKFGNSGSLHSFGQEAVRALDESREFIARAIGADFRQVIFTGSATESNNIALRGLTQTLRRFTRKNFCVSPRNVRDVQRPRIIVSAVEHESILETAKDLESEAEVIYLPVDKNGLVDLAALKKSLNPRTILVSVMYANNEIGVVQPIREIVKIVKDFRDELKIKNKELRGNPIIHNPLFTIPLFHTDAVQAFQFLDCNVQKLGVDFMTISAHKIYGPKGVGMLFIGNNELRIKNSGLKKNKTPILHNSSFIIHPLITGGGQEFGFRSGTENVPAIVGFAKAVELVSNSRELENKRIMGLKNYFWRELKKITPKAEINGSGNQTGSRFVLINEKSLPNIINVYFPGCKAEELMARLDLAGVAVSSGSACASRSAEPSHVLLAMGLGKERARGSIRFSFGRPTAKNEIKKALKIIRGILKKSGI